MLPGKMGDVGGWGKAGYQANALSLLLYGAIVASFWPQFLSSNDP